MANASGSSLPYIGSKISLISNAEIRYEGILYTINTNESTVALQNVRSFGTEGRKTPDIPASEEVYDFIIFRGRDIKDLTVCAEPMKPVPDDPAIVNVNIAPPQSSMMGGNMGDHGQGGMQGDMHRPMVNRDMGYGQGHNDRFGHGHRQMAHANYGMNRGPMGGYGHGRDENDRYYGGDYQDSGYNRGGRYGGYGYGVGGGYGGGGHMSRGGGGRYNPAGGQRHVVGELVAQLNPATKNLVSGEFDFVSANSNFQKNSMKLEDVEEQGGVKVRPGYDKVSSFFDNISCETLDRQSGQDSKVDRDRQRQLDTETFGQAANQRGSRYRRGYRRGGGYRRGRGGYGGYGGGGYSYVNNANDGPGRPSFGRGF
eukprot:Selendium_serpulae@DN3743_c0_g1_i1.p1